jgi:hypothetical protein
MGVPNLAPVSSIRRLGSRRGVTLRGGVADDLAAHRQREDGRAGVRTALLKALVRARLVIVDQERIDHRLQWRALKMSR